MVRRTNELPTTVQIQCPGCGHFSSIPIQYSEEGTADYEGACQGELEGGGLCGTYLLLTVAVSEEVEEDSFGWGKAAFRFDPTRRPDLGGNSFKVLKSRIIGGSLEIV